MYDINSPAVVSGGFLGFLAFAVVVVFLVDHLLNNGDLRWKLGMKVKALWAKRPW